MNKGLALIILGGLAVLGGAVFAAMAIKNRFSNNRDLDFDDFVGYEDFDLPLEDDEELRELKEVEKNKNS